MATLDITPNFVNTQLGTDDAIGAVTLTHVTFSATLDDILYTLDFKTNRRTNGWMLDLYSFDGTPVVLGLGLVAGVSLLYPYQKYLPVPQGTLFVSPQNAGGYIDPTLDSFVAGTHSIYYVEVGD